eukprot:351898-Chlamydomonas_euryale.AAC.2
MTVWLAQLHASTWQAGRRELPVQYRCNSVKSSVNYLVNTGAASRLARPDCAPPSQITPMLQAGGRLPAGTCRLPASGRQAARLRCQTERG